jgi:hypothetical protein
MATTASKTRREIETWFTRQGLPLFIRGDGIRPSFQRIVFAAWVLFVGEIVILAPSRALPTGIDVLAVVIGLAMLYGAVSLMVTLWGRLPRRVSVACLVTIIVVAPALGPLIVGRQLSDFALGVIFNSSLIVLGYLWFSGFTPFGKWALRESGRQALRMLRDLGQALPVLFIGAMLLFLTAEVWQMAAQLHGPFLLIVPGLFIAVGTLSLTKQLRREVKSCSEEFDNHNRHTLMEWVESLDSESTSFKELARLVPADNPNESIPLTKPQRVNIGLLLLFVESMQILIVTAVIIAFFLVFGLLAIPATTAQGYLGPQLTLTPIPQVPDVTLWGRPIVLTRELVNVTIFIGLFSYLSFVFHAATEDNYVKDFLNDAYQRIRDALAVRLLYVTVFWAPRREPISGGQLYEVTFEVPPTLKANKAELYWSRDSEPEKKTRTEMDRDADGGFSTRFTLPGGVRLQYYYLLDNKRWTDCGADESVRDASGIEESILVLARPDTPKPIVLRI